MARNRHFADTTNKFSGQTPATPDIQAHRYGGRHAACLPSQWQHSMQQSLQLIQVRLQYSHPPPSRTVRQHCYQSAERHPVAVRCPSLGGQLDYRLISLNVTQLCNFLTKSSSQHEVLREVQTATVMPCRQLIPPVQLF